MSECRNWYNGDLILEDYHDHEWCKINHDDDFQFEMLCLEGASVGLSWQTIMHKRAAYRARHAADLYGCTGWVRNEYDGSVSMEIQGEEENIDKVILAIEAGKYVRIENMDSRTIPLEEDEYGFWTR